MSEEVSEKTKRFRSPPYPAFNLEKAIDRAIELFEKANHHQVGVSVLTTAWGMESSSGKVWRTAAALLQFGILEDSGSGTARKFKLTDIGLRLAQDTNPNSEKRQEALKSAALSPMINKELWEKYGAADSLDDAVLKTHLTLDRVDEGEAPYSPSAAEDVIAMYRSSIDMAGLNKKQKAILGESKPANLVDNATQDDHAITLKIGDYVKWTSGGVDQFASKEVTWISDDRDFIRVSGSTTGIPVSEVEKVPPLNISETSGNLGHNASPLSRDDKGSEGSKPDISVYQQGDRLEIKANVDLKGIEKLEEILGHYKAVLKIMG